MFIAKVVGSVVSTQKIETMTGHKLLVVEPFRLEGKKRQKLETTGRTFIAVDTLGAGEDDFVLIAQGSSARLTPETKDLPIDAVIRYATPQNPPLAVISTISSAPNWSRSAWTRNSSRPRDTATSGASASRLAVTYRCDRDTIRNPLRHP